MCIRDSPKSDPLTTLCVVAAASVASWPRRGRRGAPHGGAALRLIRPPTMLLRLPHGAAWRRSVRPQMFLAAGGLVDGPGSLTFRT
eukprot:7378764-Pyramimonas_sp.AAC.1